MSKTIESPSAPSVRAAEMGAADQGVPVGHKGRRPSPEGGIAGREPRVDLMPNEVHIGRRERSLARRAWLGVIVIASVVVLGIGAATVNAVRIDDELQAAQGQTASLLAQQSKYGEVRSIEAQTTLLEAAQGVGGASEIDWPAYLGDLQSALPGGVSISDMTITSASPISSYAQSTTPLQGARVATLDVTLKSNEIPSVPVWTEALSGLKGYVDSNIDSVTRDDDSGGYTAMITLHVDEKAYDGKYTEGAQK